MGAVAGTAPDGAQDDAPTRRALRWALVVPAGVIGALLALLAGVQSLALLASLCPRDQVVSGLCQAWWYGPAERALYLASAGGAAVVFVLVPALLAPAARVRVARAALLCGAAIAVWLLGFAVRDAGMLVCALLGGLLAERRFTARERRRHAPLSASAGPPPPRA